MNCMCQLTSNLIWLKRFRCTPEFNGYAPKQTSRMYSSMPLHKWRNLSKLVPGISLFIHIKRSAHPVHWCACTVVKHWNHLYSCTNYHDTAQLSVSTSLLYYILPNRAKFTAHRWQQYQSTNMSISHLPIVFIFLSKKSTNYLNTDLFA